MKPRHSQQLALLPVVLFAAVAPCSMPLAVHAQEQSGAYALNSLASFPSADIAFATAGTDVVFACPALGADLSMSQFVPLSRYEFSDENAPQDFLPPVSFPYAAAHASELQFLFALPGTVPR